MKTSSITLSFFLVLILLSSWTVFADEQDDFLECLSQTCQNYYSISNVVYTPANSSYTSILEFSIRNTRFMSESTPKPQVIVTPEYEYQIPPVILCAKQSSLEIRTRSGGHDMEGLSYVSQVPFVIIDLINLSEVTVDVDAKTAWIEAGATTGIVYYRIAEKSSTLGFPGAICVTVGVGGHYSAGGYGAMLRKHGLAGDNVIDARIINANGTILDRASMGEDLFWAITGGGGGSFGVITAWKVQLVDVPETVTVFSISRTVEAQNGTGLWHRWQYVVPQADKDLFVGVIVYRVNSTVIVNFFSVYQGGADALVSYMQEIFPELGLLREDCTEMSWIQSTLFSNQMPIDPLETLLNRTQAGISQLKAKSDYVRTPVPLDAIEGMVTMLREPEADGTIYYMVPYGGRMDEIPESQTPFPHRAGALYKLAGLTYWPDSEAANTDSYISWSRRYYEYMTPYVSSSPREAYLNYRDLDLGVNNVVGETSYEQASIWAKPYYKDNFDRLVQVKTAVDPDNFFRYEQSIPPVSTYVADI
ncbi:tetrahydrocannabinolic acid synthase-like isoform X1 [Salvia hispanica]|uniref:tetrahydrocannabinolic acid synthase-like isoform X1 n=1 Tax=Salvia hispanica TaxID=49212 RepID=UPI0020096F05|nr:tetrahydrocannabinolic acid synthase-like isoform X1 [Salvia hispanica]